MKQISVWLIATVLLLSLAPRMAIAQGPAGVIIVVGETEGARGDFVSFDVTLDTGGLEVAGTQNDIVFDPSTPIAAAENGNPHCWVNPDIDKSATAFRFQPAGCEDMGIGLCTGIRALVLSLSNLDPIPDGSVMYGCEVAIAMDAPAEIFPLVNDNVGSTDPEGITLPTLGEDGAVTVVVRPEAPLCVGDANRDNQVTISELIAAVNNSLRGCPSTEALLCVGDANRDNQVTISELIAAVNNSLQGCPSAAAERHVDAAMLTLQ